MFQALPSPGPSTTQERILSTGESCLAGVVVTGKCGGGGEPKIPKTAKADLETQYFIFSSVRILNSSSSPGNRINLLLWKSYESSWPGQRQRLARPISSQKSPQGWPLQSTSIQTGHMDLRTETSHMVMTLSQTHPAHYSCLPVRLLWKKFLDMSRELSVFSMSSWFNAAMEKPANKMSSQWDLLLLFSGTVPKQRTRPTVPQTQRYQAYVLIRKTCGIPSIVALPTFPIQPSAIEPRNN